MKVTGLDRVIVMVRDMDKALELFSGKMGMKFRELDKDVQTKAGNRGYVCHETHLHLVQPFDPLPDDAPPPLRKAAEMLKDTEAMIMLMVFKTDDAKKGAQELSDQGLSVLRTWEDDQDYRSVGMANLWEYLFDPKDTMGLPILISSWDKMG
ncbi:MAG: VOC family protein [Spirochaetia bacterium]